MASQQLEGRLSMTREDRRALTSHLYKVVFFTVRDEIVTDSEKKKHSPLESISGRERRRH